MPSTRERILAALVAASAQRPITQGEVAERSGLSASTVSRHLRRMAADGDVIEGGARRTRKTGFGRGWCERALAGYYITPSGDAAAVPAEFYCPYCGSWLDVDGTVHRPDHHLDTDQRDPVEVTHYRTPSGDTD